MAEWFLYRENIKRSSFRSLLWLSPAAAPPPSGPSSSIWMVVAVGAERTKERTSDG